jgi:hypothetical protein
MESTMPGVMRRQLSLTRDPSEAYATSYQQKEAKGMALPTIGSAA